MRNVNVMIEVDDDLYTKVVEPYKKAKKFTELIKILLSGYLKDEYIGRYVEGTQDILKQKSSDSLMDALDTMRESLASLSFLNEEAGNIVEEGMSFTSKSVENASSENFEEGVRRQKEREEENEQLKKDVTELKEMFAERESHWSKQFEELKALFKGSMQIKSEVKPVSSVNVPKFDDVKLDEDDPLSVDAFSDDIEEEVIDLQGEEEEYDSDGFLDDLLEGQIISF